MVIKKFLFLCFVSLCSFPLQSEDKVALLFLTCKELNHPNLWKKGIKANHSKFKVYIHAKEPMQDPFFKKFCIKKTVQTTWSRHVLAWQILLNEALKHKKNTKFIFLSESCIPLRPLDEIYEILLADQSSRIHYGRPWWPETHPREVIEIPKEHRWVNEEWLVLNRKHARLIAQDFSIINIISQHSSDQESYPASFFSITGCLDEILNQPITFADWTRPQGSSPYTFREPISEDIERLMDAKKNYLFARKISPDFPEEILETILNANPIK